MKDVVRANPLTSRAQSELHLFGPFFGWEDSPLTAGWLSGLSGTAAVTIPRGRTQGAASRGSVPSAYPCQTRGGCHSQVQGGGVGGGGAVALETVEEACKSL